MIPTSTSEAIDHLIGQMMKDYHLSEDYLRGIDVNPISPEVFAKANTHNEVEARRGEPSTESRG